MVTLVKNKNISTIKTNTPVSIDTTFIEKVVDLRDDEGAGKTKVNVSREMGEGVMKGGPVGVVDEPKWGVNSRTQIPSV